MNDVKYFSLADAARAAGVSYGRVWYYYATQKLPEPGRLGRKRVLTSEDVDAIRRFFDDSKPVQDESINPPLKKSQPHPEGLLT